MPTFEVLSCACSVRACAKLSAVLLFVACLFAPVSNAGTACERIVVTVSVSVPVVLLIPLILEALNNVDRIEEVSIAFSLIEMI